MFKWRLYETFAVWHFCLIDDNNTNKTSQQHWGICGWKAEKLNPKPLQSTCTGVALVGSSFLYIAATLQSHQRGPDEAITLSSSYTDRHSRGTPWYAQLLLRDLWLNESESVHKTNVLAGRTMQWDSGHKHWCTVCGSVGSPGFEMSASRNSPVSVTVGGKQNTLEMCQLKTECIITVSTQFNS